VEKTGPDENGSKNTKDETNNVGESGSGNAEVVNSASAASKSFYLFLLAAVNVLALFF
jgi:hypothetical protein